MALKDKILIELQKNRETYLSGESLADTFDVSRNAVWKAINTLKREGYPIASKTNGGYQLEESCDSIEVGAICSLLPENASFPIYYYDEIDSTNTQARRTLLEQPLTEALFIADSQTAGRGRHGHDFYSPAHTGIYMSYVFRPNGQISDAVYVTTMASVAVVRTIWELYGLNADIKWVNDIYINERKICGILTEAITDLETNRGTIILGIGLNLTTKDYPAEIAARAGSLLADGTIKAINRNQLIAAIVTEVRSMVADLSDRSYLEEYRAHSMLQNCIITYMQNDLPCEATVLGIDDEAGLIIKNTDGTTSVLRNGEVSLIRRKLPPS